MKHIIHILLLTGIITPLLAFGGVFGPNNIVPFPATPAADKAPGNSMLSAAFFPTTAADTTFTERLESKSIGYEPFKDMSAYHGLVVAGEEYYTERELARLEEERQSDEQTMSRTEYCSNYPLDETLCPQDATTTEDIVTRQSNENQTFTGRTIGGGPVIVRNDVYGGSCYPAAKGRKHKFKNEVMTTGQYEKIHPAFEKAMITLFRKEGKCGEIKNDPCGYTCYGISECSGLTEAQIKKLTRADAEKFYYDRYWKKYNMDTLPDVISGDIFLAGMGSGPQTAIQQYRKFLKLPQGKTIDNNVIKATENYTGDIHNDWLDVRQEFLKTVAKRRYNNSVLNGWMNGIRLKRANGCHVIPDEPLYRD